MTWPEKPHCGKSGVPFMNKTTSLVSIVDWISSLIAIAGSFQITVFAWKMRGNLRRRTGLKLQRMQFATHGAAERFVDELMLLELGFADEFRGNDDRRIMVVVAGKVGDFDLGVRNALLDQALDFRRWHGHRVTFLIILLVFSSSRIGAFHVARKPPFMDPHQVIQQYGGPKAKGQRIPAGHADDFAGNPRGFRR